MSKGLEYFRELRNGLCKSLIISDVANEKLNLIETALKEYKVLKQDYEMIKEEYNLMIRDYAKDIKPKLKAFEIIKEKEVDVGLLIKSENVKQYNHFSKNVNQSKNLTAREFDVLKGELL